MDDPNERHIVISADGHCGADILDYKPYLATKWLDDFDVWARQFADPWSELDDNDVAFGVASMDSDYCWDSAKRQAAVEQDGIAAEVLFPNTAPPFFPSGVITAGAPRTRLEYEQRMAGLRAHNRWLADFCAEAPGQRAGVAQIFLTDADDALKEIRQIKKSGLTGGILLPGDSTDGGLVQLYYPKYDPIWALCEELDMPVAKHSSFTADPNSAENGGAGPLVGIMEASFFLSRALGHLIFAGVFERFPKLRFVFTEGGTLWVGDLLKHYDNICADSAIAGSMVNFFGRTSVPNLKRKPSEYFGTNVFIGASFMNSTQTERRAEVGVNNLMWGADMPHREGTFPHSKKALQAAFGGIPIADTKAMLCETAAHVYSFDKDKLQAVADRIGPTVAEVATPIPPAEEPAFPFESVSPAFSHRGGRSYTP
jgi:predicted TIM-barrel fold metal-dependent hydrolase